jgi:hypothetical protein
METTPIYIGVVLFLCVLIWRLIILADARKIKFI